MTRNSRPDYLVENQARRRASLDRFLSGIRQECDAIASALPYLDVSSAEFRLKQAWHSTWGSLLTSAEALLRLADKMEETDPTAAEEIVFHVTSLVNCPSAAAEIVDLSFSLGVNQSLPDLKAQGLADQGFRISQAAAEKRRPAIEKRREIIVELVGAIPSGDRRPDDELAVAVSILNNVNRDLTASGHKAVSRTTVYNDVVQLNKS